MTFWQRYRIVAVVPLLSLVAGQAMALDQRIGQAWTCENAETRLRYVIGKLENISSVLGGAPESGDVLVAHLHV